ncbi:MAG: hypothetical protein WCP72_10515 [Desulfomonile sp.]
MITWKNFIILGTVMMFVLVNGQASAQTPPGVVTNANHPQDAPARPGIPQGTLPDLGNQASGTPNPGVGLEAQRHQQAENAQSWPNYPYSHYNNPYYDGGSPGNLISGVIDWALAFPLSTWNRLSEFLDTNLFPRSPATYGGKPTVQQVAPNKKSQDSPELPSASPYNPGGR